jgi:hypothetical protein
VFSRAQLFIFPTFISVKQHIEGIASALPLCGVGWSKDCFYACLDETRGLYYGLGVGICYLDCV